MADLPDDPGHPAFAPVGDDQEEHQAAAPTDAVDGEGDGNVVQLGKARKKKAAAKTSPPLSPNKGASAPGKGEGAKGGGKKREDKPVDWGKYNLLVEQFALIYGTDTVWDGSTRTIMKIGNMAHAHGSDLVRMWKVSEKRRTVLQSEVVFDPTNTCSDRCINLYDGFATTPTPSTDEDVAVMLELLRHLCGNCATDATSIDDVMRWVLCWLALPLQRPGAKLKTALIFHGPQGTGKNLFFDAVRAIYGKYGVMVGQNELEEKYNAWISAKLMIIGNEVVTRQELYHNKNKLKWVVTEEQIPIRAMQSDVRWESNHANVVFLSNESMPLVLEDDDRRHLVVYTPQANDDGLYGRVAAFLKDGGSSRFMAYLQRYDVGDFNPHTKPLMTSAKADLITLSMKPAERFMAEWLQGFLPLPLQVCSTEQLYRAFRRWCDQAGERFPPAREAFTKAAERWVTERVERDGAGARMDPRLSLKVIQLKDAEAKNGRKAMRCWLPRGTGPREAGVSLGEWAADCVEAFDKRLNKFFYANRETGGSDAPVTPNA